MASCIWKWLFFAARNKIPKDQAITITENGTTNAPSGTRYTPITVNVAGSSVTEPYVEETYNVGRNLTAAKMVGQTVVRDYAFYYCTFLTSITIPNSVTSIGKSAFKECRALTSITIPNSVTSIGNEAFGSCTSLTSITIPDSVMSIEANTFYYCTSLTSITIPSGVTSIGNSAFISCYALTSITVPDRVTSIGGGALQIGSITHKATITMLPTTPPTISSNTFISTKLNKIIVPAGTGDTYKSATNWSAFADYIEEATA